jgi:hypothetical protein
MNKHIAIALVALTVAACTCGDNSTPTATGGVHPLPPQHPAPPEPSTPDANVAIRPCSALACLSVSCDDGYCECELGPNDYVVCSYDVDGGGL